MGAIKYRHYPSAVKDEIFKTQNIYLFPEFNIPRTTAQYWLKKRNLDTSNVISIEKICQKKSQYLTQELEKERAFRILLQTVRRIFPFDFRRKRVKNKIARSQIIIAIRECLKYHKLSHCLITIGLSKSSYLRWASESSLCSRSKNLCSRRSSNQLTTNEILTMKKFVTSRKYAHISICSLQLLAQRTGELFCSLETWYKYIKCFGWKRPWSSIKKTFQKKGIRSHRPNEIWHLDVTQVNIRPGYKLYIQAVIDNFSRYVLAWKISDKINAINTIETISMAKSKAAELLNPIESTCIMMDPGTENKNTGVLKFMTSRNLNRILAQVDVHYSNSMIESLFRLLKNNYLYHRGIHTIEDLTRKVNFYFNQHNEVIPLMAHKGGRPLELYVSSWGENERSVLTINKAEAIKRRKIENLQPPCNNCPT